jgi:secernin
MWGAEMGSNEHDVVIGNEAIFSIETDRLKAKELIEPGLLGMDLVRLGLERAESALQALDIITDLLEKHGQSGLCVEKNDPDSGNEKRFKLDRSQHWSQSIVTCVLCSEYLN